MKIASNGWRLGHSAAGEDLLSGEEIESAADFARFDLEPVKNLVAHKRIDRFVDPAGQAFYLKRWQGVPWREALAYRLTFGSLWSAAAREWRALEHLASHDIAAPCPVMFGERRRCGLVREAFLVTRALPPGRSLTRVLTEDFEPPLDDARRKRLADLARRLGRILLAMHASGLNHRDFYAGHLHVDDRDQLWVLDLDRADVRARVGRRWRVKDAAALHFSTPSRLVPDRERLRFLAAYATGPLREMRDFAAAVEEKAQVIRAHVTKRIAEGKPNFHLEE